MLYQIYDLNQSHASPEGAILTGDSEWDLFLLLNTRQISESMVYVLNKKKHGDENSPRATNDQEVRLWFLKCTQDLFGMQV